MTEHGVDIVLLISRWLHLSAAIVTIGAAFFMRFALGPAAAASLDEAAHDRLREAVRQRWARVVHTSIAILLVTGGYNFVVLALPPRIEPMPYHAIFGFKFLGALAIFFIASILVGKGAGFPGMRARRASWLTFLLVTAGVVVLVSGVLNQIRTRPAQVAVANEAAARPSD